MIFHITLIAKLSSHMSLTTPLVDERSPTTPMDSPSSWPEKSLNTVSVQLYLARSRKKSTRATTTEEVNMPFSAVAAGRDLFVMVRTSAVEL